MIRKFLVQILALFAWISVPAYAQEQQTVDTLPWVKGPTAQAVGSHASIQVPKGAMFLDTTGTQELLRMTQNTPDPGAVTIASQDLTWFAILKYDDTGHIADDEAIDGDALFKSMKDNEVAANEEKGRLGFGKLFLDGWSVEPHYDNQTRNLEWGLKLHDEKGNQMINYTTRTLGREGLVAATLVTDPNAFNGDLADFRQAMSGLTFNAGQTYAEFRQGDRTAEYGLAALVAGGAAAAAVKSGAGKGLFKMLFVGIAAAFAAVVGFFKRLFGGSK